LQGKRSAMISKNCRIRCFEDKKNIHVCLPFFPLLCMARKKGAFGCRWTGPGGSGSIPHTLAITLKSIKIEHPQYILNPKNETSSCCWTHQHRLNYLILAVITSFF